MFTEQLESKGIIIKHNSQGQQKTLCPECSHTRKNKTEKCLSVNIDEGTYYCHNCGWHGSVKPSSKTSTPDWDLQSYFNLRKISNATLKALNITAKGDSIFFNYMLNDQVHNTKIRAFDKSRFYFSKKSKKQIVYNYDAINDDQVIICEGEIDVATFYECGFKYAISLPTGAKSSKAFLDDLAKVLNGTKSIIICTDNDIPGQEAEQRLIEAFGMERCSVTRFQNGRKDINQVLCLDGIGAVNEVIKNVLPAVNFSNRNFKFFSEKFTKKGDFSGLDLNYDRLVLLFESFGFKNYIFSSDDKKIERLVRIVDNVIHYANTSEIVRILRDFLNSDYNFEGFIYADATMVMDLVLKKSSTALSDKVLGALSVIDNNALHVNEKDAGYFFYKNTVIEVRPNGYSKIDYKQLKGYIWAHQINDRVFDLDTTKINEKAKESIICDFCHKIAGEIEGRYDALRSIMGYLMHNFFDYHLKVINFTDSSTSEHADGRSGKSLLLEALGKVVGASKIDGKTLDPEDKFKYSALREQSQLMYIDDIITKQGKRKFDVQDLFNHIHDGVIIERKYESPTRSLVKIAISCNESLLVEGGSAKHRLLEYELTTYFHSGHTPLEEYGHWFFNDWKKEEWALFDAYMCESMHLFLKNGLMEARHINLGYRKILDHCGEDFYEFMQKLEEEGNYLGEFKNVIYDKRQLYDNFREENSPDYDKLSRRKFTFWLRTYAKEILGLEKVKESRSSTIRRIQFTEDDGEGLESNE